MAKHRRSKGGSIDPQRAYYDLVALQAERAAAFYARNFAAIKMLNKMLGYGFINRKFEQAIAIASDDFDERHAKIRISLETQIFTNLFAAVRVLSGGMIQECQILMRSAFEALQYFRLLFYDPSLCETFEADPLRPVEVRKRLEAIGHDAVEVRRIYDQMSVASHVGGPGKLDFNVKEIDNFPKIVVGGYVEPATQDALLVDIIIMLHMYQGFGSGIGEEQIADYFKELRRGADAKVMGPERVKEVVAIILKFQFKRK